MLKALFSISFIFYASLLFAKEGTVMLYCKSKGAIVYVDGNRSLVVETEVTPIKIEEGDHLIKVVEPISNQCEKYEEREVYVSAEGSVKVRVLLEKKLEPTEAFKKTREKSDRLKLERFSRSNGETVTDKRLNIVWQDNKVTDTLKSFDKAESYCKTLELEDFKDWRLPTYEELLSIVDYDRYNVALMPTFKNSFSGDYWSATKDASSLKYVWSVDFHHGSTKSSEQEKRLHTRCVRGVTKNNSSQLIWDDSKASKIIKKDWKNAKIYCQEMVLGAKDDWRLPSIKELQSIVDSKYYKPAIKNGFKYVAEAYYWSSTEDISTDDYAWSVAFNYGVTSRDSILNEYGVRCVRDE